VRDGRGVGGGIMIVCGGVTKVRWKKGWEGEITVGEKNSIFDPFAVTDIN